ncbi:IniB N-terminal domain-containing protein [Amycolatopsis sp. NPDC054798]
MDPVQTLHDFTLTLLQDPSALAAFGQDPQAALAAAGLGDISAADVNEVAPLVLDYVPVDHLASLGHLPQAGDLTTALSDGPQGAIEQLQALTASLGLPAGGAAASAGAPELPGLGELPAVPGVGDLPGLGELPGADALPAVGDLPGLGELPVVSDVAGASALPAAGELPGLSDLPTVPGLGELPGAGALPGVGALPGLGDVASAVPALPAAGELPSVPAVPAVPGLPSVPGVGDVQNAAASVTALVQNPTSALALGNDLASGLDSSAVAQASGQAAAAADGAISQVQHVGGELAAASPVNVSDLPVANSAGQVAAHATEAGGGVAGHVSDAVGSVTEHVGSLSSALSADGLNHAVNGVTQQAHSLISHGETERSDAATEAHTGTDAGVGMVHDTVSTVSDLGHQGLGLDLHAGAETSHGGGELHISL